jgi:hypothetical protein
LRHTHTKGQPTRGRECGFRSCVCESHSWAMTRAAASFSFGKARSKPDGVLRVRLSSLISHEPSFGSDSRLTVFQNRRSVRSALDVWLSVGEPEVGPAGREWQEACASERQHGTGLDSRTAATASQRGKEARTRKGRGSSRCRCLLLLLLLLVGSVVRVVGESLCRTGNPARAAQAEKLPR